MEAMRESLRSSEVPFDHIFASDICPSAQKTLKANSPNLHLYYDLTKRNNKHTPKVDLYVAGFPCQPFSRAGRRQGTKDKKRGKVELCCAQRFHVISHHLGS